MLFVAKGEKNTRLYSPDWSPTVAPGGGRWRSSLDAVTWTGSGSTIRTKCTNKIRPLLQNKPSPRPVWWWRSALLLENPCLNPLKSATVQKHESGVTRGIRQNTAVTFGPSQRVSKDDDSVCCINREACDSGNSGVLRKPWPPVTYQSLSMVGAAGNSSDSEWD